jgi:hypothetical protein
MNAVQRSVLRIGQRLLWISLLISIQRIASAFQLHTNVLCRTSHYWRNVALAAAVDENEPDLFEYFDPLLSPHAYPKGISSDSKPVELVDEDRNAGEDPFTFRSSFNVKKSFGIEIPFVLERKEERSIVDTSTTFDPTLSPHAYSTGRVPDAIVGDNDADYIHTNARVVGILLMDHGSRNSASNRRLHELAKLYEDSLQKDNDNKASSMKTIVRAAHMEIATPTVQDGIATLLELGVEEIICHPFFLSPGRHVQEDIPRIVKDAIDTLKVTIPVKTSAHIGSRTEIMIGAIHSLVSETSEILETK